MMKKFMEEAVPKYLQFIENDIGKFGKDGFAVSRWVSLRIKKTQNNMHI